MSDKPNHLHDNPKDDDIEWERITESAKEDALANVKNALKDSRRTALRFSEEKFS